MRQEEKDKAVKYPGRGDAPLSEKVWEHVGAAAVGAAKARLCVRRILDVEGPCGPGTKSIPTLEAPTGHKATMGDATATVAGPGVIPLAGINTTFQVGMRDMAAFEEAGTPFDTSATAHAATACAKMEDELLVNGARNLRAEGLLNTKGALCAT